MAIYQSHTTQECTTLKMTKITTISAAAVAAGAMSILGAPIAYAEASTQTLGSQGKLTDGAVVQGWTIDNLRPSTDTIPHPVRGTLWEATANDQAIQGSVTPIVSNLNARAANGETYRALFGAATPQGVNPSTLAQGQQTTGKVYFDVTGERPDSVVYNAGGQDLLVWVQPPPSASRSVAPSTSYPSTRYPSQSPATEEPAATPAAPAAAPGAPAPGAPATAGAELAPPAGSQGTPLPEGSQGTPLPAGSQGTPLPEGEAAQVAPPVEGAPLPASAELAPQPAGSQGTPVAPEQVPTPTTYTPAPTP
jgi:hypothetical protein